MTSNFCLFFYSDTTTYCMEAICKPNSFRSTFFLFYRRAGENSRIKHSVILATASPAKFPEAVSTAGLTPEDNPIVEKWLKLPSKETIMAVDQDWEKILRNKVEEITRRVEGL